MVMRCLFNIWEKILIIVSLTFLKKIKRRDEIN